MLLLNIRDISEAQKLVFVVLLEIYLTK